jgi:hypothetical protein
MRAAWNGDETVMSLLIERGANLDIQDNVRIVIIFFFQFLGRKISPSNCKRGEGN